MTGAVTDPYAIEARHTYVGNVGDIFVAILTVTDTDGQTGTDQYLVKIKDGADLAVQVNVAIDEGLWRLHKDMVRDTFGDGTSYGYWPYGGNSVAATAGSTEAFEINGSLPTGDPGEDPYAETVQRGLNYLLSRLYRVDVAQDGGCPQGNPDANGNGYGLLSWGNTMYEGGMSLMALSSSGCPGCTAATGISEVLGRSYLDIAQDMVDAFAYCQTDPSQGVYRGGWRYNCNSGDSDNSVSQWPVIGMESAVVNFGSTVPQFVKDELSLWIDYIQNDDNGGAGYTDPGGPNVARTGGLLAEMKFFGDTIAAERVQRAANYIYTNWQTDWEHFPANSYYAFYSVMKGFRLLGIDTINPINDPSGFDWYSDPAWGYAQHIVGDQATDGGWYGGYWASHPLQSAWAILTLKKTVVQPGPVADAGPDVPSHPPVIDITFDGTGSYHLDPAQSPYRPVYLGLWRRFVAAGRLYCVPRLPGRLQPRRHHRLDGYSQRLRGHPDRGRRQRPGPIRQRHDYRPHHRTTMDAGGRCRRTLHPLSLLAGNPRRFGFLRPWRRVIPRPEPPLAQLPRELGVGP